MSTKNQSFVAAMVAAGIALPLLAQQPAAPAEQAKPEAVAAAAGTTTPVSQTPIVVRAVKGKVLYRTSPDAQRKQAAQGDVLTEGSEISTTVNSAIELQVGVGQVFTIDRLTRVILREAIATQGREKTTVAVPYGRVTFEVSSATVANDVQIQAPDATLAVKGTTGGIEITPGFPTLAFGGELNRGVFDVSFERDIVSTFRGSEHADNKIPQTGKYELEEQFVNTGDGRSQEGDEHDAARDDQTVLFKLVENLQGLNLILEGRAGSSATGSPLDTGFLSFDEYTGDLHVGNLLGQDLVLDVGDGELKPVLGAAITPAGGGGRSLYTLSMQRGADEREHAVLSRTDITGQGVSPTTVTDRYERQSFGGSMRSWELAGLASIGSRLFTSGTMLEEFESSGGAFSIVSLPTIFQLDLSEPTGTPIERMVLPMDFQAGAMAGAPTRGSIFVLGSITGSFQLSGAGANAALFEVDPRNNYMVSARSAQGGDFAVQSGTTVSGAVNPASLQRVTGMTYLGNTLVMTAIDTNGNQVFVQYNPLATNSASDPRMRRIDAIAPSFGRVGELASESIGPVQTSIELGEPTSPIDLSSINQTFAQLAYSAQAASSPALRGLVNEHIARTAVDPAGCRASAELNGPMIPGFLGQHINQRAGVGQTVFQFRNAIGPTHPCRPHGGG